MIRTRREIILSQVRAWVEISGHRIAAKIFKMLQLVKTFVFDVGKRDIYGQLVRALEHAPTSTDCAGRYGSLNPAPMAGLPGASAKFVPTGGVDSVPTELVPTFTHPGLVFSMFGGTL